MEKLLKKAGELGFLSIDIPEAYGGLDQTKTASMHVAEKIAPTGSFGVGVRFFFGEWFAIRIDVRDQILQQELLGESTIVNNVTATVPAPTIRRLFQSVRR